MSLTIQPFSHLAIKKEHFLLTIIILVGGYLRFSHLNWGDGHFFHPDENNMARAISRLCITTPGVMEVTDACSLNPHFFAYGQFPLYLAYFSAQISSITSNFHVELPQAIFWLRFWSALSSTLTIPLVYFITKEIFPNKKAPKQVRGGLDISAVSKPAETDYQSSILYHSAPYLSTLTTYVSTKSNSPGRRCGPDGNRTRNVRLIVGWFTNLAYRPLSAKANKILANFKANVNSLALISTIFVAFTPGLIQAAHFGTTESLLTFFFMLILYLSLILIQRLRTSNPCPAPCQRLWCGVEPRTAIPLGIASGLALATKLTAAYFLSAPLIALLILKLKSKISNIKYLPRTVTQSLVRGLISNFKFLILTLVFAIIFSPYNLIDFNSFISSLKYETAVATGNLKVFYTRQFEGTTPILFQAVHIFPYTLGLPLFVIGTLGFMLILISNIKYLPCTVTQSLVRGLISKRISNSKYKSSRHFPFLNSHFSFPISHFSFLIIAFLAYFLPNAMIFTKWTRFMTPILPFFAIFGAYFLQQLQILFPTKKSALRRTFGDSSLSRTILAYHPFSFISHFNQYVKRVDRPRLAPGESWMISQIPNYSRPTYIAFTILLIILSTLPGLLFYRIYTRPDTRVAASEWIYENIPQGSYILSETGNVVDLPVCETQGVLRSKSPCVNYRVIPFDFYNLDDNPGLQDELLTHLEKSDYIIIPSRRVYANLDTDTTQGVLCNKSPCVKGDATKYPLTSAYYRALFSGRLGFELVHTEFSYPQFQIVDERSEETWQVFDHPTVRIYKKKKQYNKKEYLKILNY